MYFLQILSLCALVAAAPYYPNTTLSTNITASPVDLDKRWIHYGWIGSFVANKCRKTGKKPKDVNPNDPNVKEEEGWVRGPRPKLFKNVCTPFTAQDDDLGINWGSDMYAIKAVLVFPNTECIGNPSGTIRSSDPWCFKAKKFPGMAAVKAIFDDGNDDEVGLKAHNTTRHLIKRSSYGWIGSAVAKDCRTNGRLPKGRHKNDPNTMEDGWFIKPRPKFDKSPECVPFRPQTDDISINWGSGYWEMNTERVFFYDKADCGGDWGRPIKVLNRKKGAYARCIKTKDVPGLLAVRALWPGNMKYDETFLKPVEKGGVTQGE